MNNVAEKEFVYYEDIDELIKWLKDNLKRFVTEVHLHHCWKPDKSSYLNSNDKNALIQKIFYYDTKVKGNTDFSYHLLITPDGRIWLNRDINSPPSSIKGRNGTEQFGPISVAILGNFDVGKDKLEGVQKERLIVLLDVLMKMYHINDEKLIFLSDSSPRTSPGNTINKCELLRLIWGDEKIDTNIKDIEGHPYEDAIKQAVELGAMGIFSDGRFRPNAVVTRADLAKFFCKIYGGIK